MTKIHAFLLAMAAANVEVFISEHSSSVCVSTGYIPDTMVLNVLEQYERFGFDIKDLTVTNWNMLDGSSPLFVGAFFDVKEVFDCVGNVRSHSTFLTDGGHILVPIQPQDIELYQQIMAPCYPNPLKYMGDDEFSVSTSLPNVPTNQLEYWNLHAMLRYDVNSRREILRTINKGRDARDKELSDWLDAN
jgi:hypothetical protein